MKCVLEDLVVSEHKNANEKYKNYFINCPLFDGRQICYWCCLHIHDIAEPLRRGDYSLEHPEYESVVAKETGREWDDIWSTCSKCSH